MLFSWPARVVAHLGELVVVQVPGGLLLAVDPSGQLRDGDETEVQVRDRLTDADFDVAWGDFYQVTQTGNVALLKSSFGFTTPLLLRTGETLPASLALSIPRDDSPVVDEDEVKPFHSDPPNCCPDADPAQIAHHIPCCCPDVAPFDVTHGPTLFSFLAELLSPPESP